MSELIMRLEWWHWWIVAAVLAAVETMMPGAVAIWFAASAGLVGALLVIMPIPWQLQLVLFGTLGIAALFAWRRFKRTHPETSDLPRLNQRSAQYVGQLCQLSAPIAGGYGKAIVGDGVWKVRGPDLPAGARVRVIAAEGALLVVEAA